jgi:uncharacterized membrane protein YccC
MRESRRLEDRIRQLSARVLQANADELQQLISQLQVALAEYIRRTENRTSAIVFRLAGVSGDRRKKLPRPSI